MICILNSIKYNSAFYRGIILNDEEMLCVQAAMQQFSREHTTATGKGYSYPVIKKYLQEWAKLRFSAPVEEVYTSIVSQFPVCEILPEQELRSAIAKYESRTISNFRDENMVEQKKKEP